MTWNTLGFQHIKDFFKKAVKNGTLVHTYLFHGQDMIGKRTFALELISKIADPTDIIVAGRDIAAAREAKRFLSLSPLNGSYKAVVIDEAQEMQGEAQNAMLKILEEPSGKTVIILIARQPESLLPTIVSRCQQIFFPAHSREIYEQYYRDKKLSQNQRDFLYDFSNGSIGLLYNADDFKKIKTFAQELIVISKADINRRFAAAQNLAQDEELRKKILFWMLYMRSKKKYKLLDNLLALYKTISQSQFNKQLALENFMLQL